MKTLVRIAVAVAALGLVGAAAGAVPKPTLTVAISGDGTVTSHPAGISCHPSCKLHAHKGEKVTLTATPYSGSEFSHWSAPCGTNVKCTVKVTGSRVVHAFFKAEPKPPAPPPPPAKAGHYVGTYSDGTTFNFDVQGTSFTNFAFDFNGECSDGDTLAGPLTTVNGSFAIGSDGSVSGHIPLTYNDASGSADFAGSLTTTGTGTGTLKISVTFTSGDDATCTSTGTWMSQDQS